MITDSEFTLYLLCGYFILCGHAWIPHVSRAYERYFATIDWSQYSTWWWWLTVPPSVEDLSLGILLSNACLAVSTISYLYMNRNPSVANQDYYLSIEALGLAVLTLKLAWHYFLMTFYRRYWGLVVALVCVTVQILIILSVIILLAVRTQWLAFAFMWPTAFFYALCASWTYTIWQQYQYITSDLLHHNQ